MNAIAAQTTSSLTSLLSPEVKKHNEMTHTAEKWVAQTFFGTMLKQMRNSPFKTEMFDGGRGGEAFHEMLDQHLAEHMSRGAGRKLVNSIVRKMEGKAAYDRVSKLAAKKVDAGTVQAIAATNSGNMNRGGR